MAHDMSIENPLLGKESEYAGSAAGYVKILYDISQDSTKAIFFLAERLAKRVDFERSGFWHKFEGEYENTSNSVNISHDTILLIKKDSAHFVYRPLDGLTGARNGEYHFQIFNDGEKDRFVYDEFYTPTKIGAGYFLHSNDVRKTQVGHYDSHYDSFLRREQEVADSLRPNDLVRIKTTLATLWHYVSLRK